MTYSNRHTKTDDETRRAIYRVLEYVAEVKDATKQDLCEVAMSEVQHQSATKSHAIIDTMVAMQYMNRTYGEDGRSYSYELTVYGTRLLNSFSQYYKTR